MSEDKLPPPSADRPVAEAQAQIRRRLGFTWTWLLPLSALALVGYLVYSLALERGPTITITFETADGLVAQQTQVRYRAVTLGTVEHIDLTDDQSHVVARVRMTADAASLLTEEARFWVVKPRLGQGLAAFRSGLETLVSGVYVAVDPGPKGGKFQTVFKGLEQPPSVRSDEPGSVYLLSAPSVSGLSEGSPVFYRDVSVGDVLNVQLDDKSQAVSVRIFVRSPYDHRVNDETHFWNASGVSIDTGSAGLRLKLQSVDALLNGGIAFGSPPGAESKPQAQAGKTFTLYGDEAQAEVDFYGQSDSYVSYFQSSIRGLSVGSTVHLFGKRFGAVTAIDLVPDPRPNHENQIAARVAFVLQPGRASSERERQALDREGLRELIQKQLRVVLSSSSFITGQKELSLEFVPAAKLQPLTEEGNALVLPGEGQDLQDLTGALTEILKDIKSIPFQEIGENANRTLASVERTIGGPELKRAIASLDQTLKEVGQLAQDAQKDLGPALARLPTISEKLERAVDQAQLALGQSGYGSDSSTQRNLDRMMGQVADAARSIRLLADYLNQHPESLISGRKEGAP